MGEDIYKEALIFLFTQIGFFGIRVILPPK